jgi:hypothetical protein
MGSSRLFTGDREIRWHRRHLNFPEQHFDLMLEEMLPVGIAKRESLLPRQPDPPRRPGVKGQAIPGRLAAEASFRSPLLDEVLQVDRRRQLFKAAELQVDPDEKARLRDVVDKYGPNYYRPNVRKSLEAAEKDGSVIELPDDPWSNVWTGTSIETMFDEVRGDYLYDAVFRDSTEWLHWGPRSILRAMEPADQGVGGFTQDDWLAAASALMSGCLSLLQALEALDRHFSLGIAERLAEPAKEIEAINAQATAEATLGLPFG